MKNYNGTGSITTACSMARVIPKNFLKVEAATAVGKAECIMKF